MDILKVLFIIPILFYNYDNTTHKMKTEITELDKHLRENRPKYYSKLNAPLSKEEISKLEKQYNVIIPSDLKELYLWKNGQEQECYENFVNNCMFEPLENVLEGNQELTDMIGYDFGIENWWNQNWLPIFSNGRGDYICYDLKGVFTEQKGQLIEYWNRENDRTVIAPSLKKIIEKLNLYYKNTPTIDFDETFSIQNDMNEWKRKYIVDKPIKK